MSYLINYASLNKCMPHLFRNMPPPYEFMFTCVNVSSTMYLCLSYVNVYLIHTMHPSPF